MMQIHFHSQMWFAIRLLVAGGILGGVSICPKITSAQSALLQSIQVQVSVVQNTPLYSYSYQISNPKTNSQAVWNLYLDISQPASGLTLSNQGLTNGSGFASQIAAVVLNNPNTIPIVPVGLSAPANWRVSIAVAGEADWIAVADGGAIASGSFDSGFEIVSPGLPGIRKITAAANYDISTLPITPPADPSDLQRYNNDLAAALRNYRVSVMTIGPTAPPATFVALNF